MGTPGLQGAPKRFGRDVLTVLTGTVVSQGLLIAVLPLLTRAYSTAEFGYFGAYSAAVALVSIFMNLRLDLTVVTAPSEEVAARLALLSLYGAAVLAAAGASITALGVFAWSAYSGAPPRLWVIAIPLAAAATAMFNTYVAWHGRKERFRQIANLRFVQALLMIGLQAAFIWWLPLASGLIVGSMLAVLATTAGWTIWTKIADGHLRTPVGWRESWQQVVAMKAFSSRAITIDALSQLLSQLPMAYLGMQFSAQAMGHFTLTQRILAMPAGVLGNAVAEVFRQRATQTYAREGNCQRLFVGTLKILAVPAALICLCLVWLLPDLFAWVFGGAWRESGRFAQILLPAFALRLLAHPLSFLVLLRNKLDFEIALHVLMLTALLLGLSFGAHFGLSPGAMLAYYSLIYVLMYFAYLVYSYRLSLGEHHHAPAVAA